MQLHELTGYNRKKPQRIGRGGKRGTTSGRGQKGQKSRSGRKLRPASRDLILRLPKLRGFANKPKSDKPEIFDLGTLSSRLKSFVGKGPLAVNAALLKEAKLLSPSYRGEVKILSDGAMAFPIVVSGCKVSAAAKAKIEEAGGKVNG